MQCESLGWGHVRQGRGPWLAMRFPRKIHMGRCVGARACGQDIPARGAVRGLGVMHFGVQAAMGPMCFVWIVYLLRYDLHLHLSPTCASTLPARSDVVPHISCGWSLKAVGGRV